MARMICAIDQIKNRGEEAFYHALDRYLDNSHVVYWNREVYGREFDYCVLIPEVGIVVIEVKGWQESTVIGVPQGEYISIRTEHGEEHSNPRSQARGYRFGVVKFGAVIKLVKIGLRNAGTNFWLGYCWLLSTERIVHIPFFNVFRLFSKPC